MKALTFSSARGLQLDDRSEQAESCTEARIDVIYAGICSTVRLFPRFYEFVLCLPHSSRHAQADMHKNRKSD